LVIAQDILDRSRLFHKSSGGFADRPQRQFRGVAGAFGLDPDGMEYGVIRCRAHTVERFVELLEFTPGEFVQRYSGVYDRGIVSSLLKPADEFKIPRSLQFAQDHLLHMLTLGLQMRHELRQRLAVSRIQAGGLSVEVGDLDVEIAGLA